MNTMKMWHTFETTGRVEDYLRYRGYDQVAETAGCAKKETAYGERTETAPDDGRTGSPGV